MCLVQTRRNSKIIELQERQLKAGSDKNDGIMEGIRVQKHAEKFH